VPEAVAEKALLVVSLAYLADIHPSCHHLRVTGLAVAVLGD